MVCRVKHYDTDNFDIENVDVLKILNNASSEPCSDDDIHGF